MYQNDRGNYKKQETVGQLFMHSCLGKLIIAAAVVALLLIIARLTVPSEQTMKEEMIDDIRQCIEANDSVRGDWLDDAVNNVGYIFTHADDNVDEELWAAFNKYNRLEYFKHTFYHTARLYNNIKPEGTRAGIGIFGIVIPTVNFNDFLLQEGPMHKGYNQQIINVVGTEEYFGDNPNLKEFHYRGNPED